MAQKALPEQSVLLQLLRYEPETGKLFWRDRGVEWFPAATQNRSSSLCRLWNERYAGKEAFTCVSDGYRTGAILSSNYKAQRIIWKMRTGAEPCQIDHVNGTRSDNRLENLRNVTMSENAKNRRIPANNRTGLIGVYRWSNGRNVYWVVTSPEKSSGNYFHCVGQAIAARKAVEAKLGFHPNHGRAV
jgi:hypothetical protein